MKNFKSILFIGLLVALVAIFVLIYTVAMKTANSPTQPQVNKTSGNVSTNNTNEPPATVDPVRGQLTRVDSQNLKFTNTSQGYSFVFPDDKFTENPGFPIMTPFGPYHQNLNPDITMYRELAVEHCFLSGKCDSVTNNMAFGAIKLADTMQEFLQSEEGKAATIETIGNKKFYIIEQGAEGEGIIYYITATPDGKVLLLFRTYINEEIVLTYKKAKDFIKYADQTKIMNSVLQSLTFQN